MKVAGKVAVACALGFGAGALAATIARELRVSDEPVAVIERSARPDDDRARPEAEPLGLPDDASELDRIEGRLAALERAVAGLTDALRSRAPAGGATTDPDLAELRGTVADLETTLAGLPEAVARRLEETGGAEGAGELRRLKAEKPEPDWAELERLVARWRLDPDVTGKELSLVEDGEVLRRYGTPTEIWSNEKGTHWVYGRDYDPIEASYGLEVYLRLQDGIVTTLGVAER